jgi:hypothetical protein
MPSKLWIEANKERWLATRRRWYKENAPQVRAAVAQRKEKLREWFAEYKSTLRCQQCGEDDIVTLDFHHREPNGKDASIARAIHDNWGIERVLKEITKCDILCGNCHRKLHRGA